MAGLAHAPLLCELHAHTTWSDGSQTIGQLVDSYGQAGFDVLCITDHVVRTDDPASESQLAPEHVHARNHSAYVMAIEIEAARARVQYDMLVLPGLELTYDDPDPCAPLTQWPSDSSPSSPSTTASNARSATRDARAQRSSPRTPTRRRLPGGAARDRALRGRMASSRRSSIAGS